MHQQKARATAAIEPGFFGRCQFRRSPNYLFEEPAGGVRLSLATFPLYAQIMYNIGRTSQ